MVFREDVLADKVAVVTGGGTGIGSSIVLALARVGCDVAICSRDVSHLAANAAAVTELGRRCHVGACDVRDAERVEEFFEEAGRELGGIDILVNNAAGNFLCPAADLSANGFRSVVEIDLVGSFICARAVFPYLRKRGGGAIINISATLDYQGVPLQAHAGSAKAGVDALTRHLATEWGPFGVRVVGVAPGPIADTEGMRRLGGGREQSIAEQIPLRRLGSRDDVAAMAVFLASDAASWITGTTMIVDGGQRLRAKTWLEGE